MVIQYYTSKFHFYILDHDNNKLFKMQGSFLFTLIAHTDLPVSKNSGLNFSYTSFFLPNLRLYLLIDGCELGQIIPQKIQE